MVGKRDCGDASCRHCGAPIYFEVGPPGVINCPACGKDWQHTDEEIEERRREMSREPDWNELLRNPIEFACVELYDLANAPPDMNVPAAVKATAQRLIDEMRKLRATV
jgi:hypothetical protein